MLRHTLLLVLAAGLCTTIFAVPARGQVAEAPSASVQPSAQVPIRRITMYRSGVASFARSGPVTGDAKLQFRFSTDQINDILQSMFVLDLSKGQGRIDGISYGSKEPLAKRLASFGVDIADDPAAGEMLKRLRGTPVKLTLNAGEVSGTIMNVENRQTVFQGSNGTDTAVHNLPWINLLTAAGVRSFNLTECRGFEILDTAMAGELNKALAALAEYRADRTKTVDVSLSGEGTREIVVAYVQEAPVWKTSYRLVLPPGTKPAAGADPAKTPADRFTVQGWAIVENTTDEDWRDVTLSLVSGRPVSFRMDLYEPLYMERPELPVPTEQGVSPRVYEGGQSPFRDNMLSDAANGPGVSKSAERRAGRPMSPAASPMTAAPGSPTGGAWAAKSISGEDMASYGAGSQARAVESGEVFQFEVDHPVTVERQRSAMIPIINTGVEGRRVSIYNAADSGSHPMRGIEVKNTTGLQLMPGPISVFDDGVYAGDAQIGHVPAGDKRLLSYAVDLELNAVSENKGAEEIRRVRIVKGLLEIQTKYRHTITYTFANKDLARARTIITEYPRSSGWELSEGTKPVEQTESLLRFETTADAGKQAKQVIGLERVGEQSLQLTSIDQPTLLLFSKSGKVSEAVMNAFREAAKRQGVINDLQRQVASLEKERADINTDQARIRQNMGTNTIDRQSELYTRYVKKLNEQETRLEAINEAVSKTNADLVKATSDLGEFLSNLSVE